MRIVLIGKGSFIARAVAAAAGKRGLNVVPLAHDAALDGLAPQDSVINFALHPDYRNAAYVEARDRDLVAARHAARAGASFTMLSTRRVYDAAVRWNAMESGPAKGDETAYGQNKARTEQAVLEATDGKAGIFRLANIIGFEPERHSFMGLLLTGLRQTGDARFDMHPDTRRDFLAVETAAAALLDRAVQRASGICNLGSGVATPSGDVARWVMAGYGAGRLLQDGAPLQDEFFLNMDRWRGAYGPLRQEQTLEDYCTLLGQRLRCEKY